MSTENGNDGENGLNGAGHPAESDPFEAQDVELGEAEIAAPPSNVAELYASFLRFAAQKYKVPLDFEEETLPIVDQYVRDARAEITVRPESLMLVAASIGAYLGEVVRRRYGGYWVADGEHEGYRVLLSRVHVSFNPIGMALESLTGTEATGWGAHFELDPGEREVVNARLEVIPPVDEDQYYLPSTRMEVLSVVYETLRRSMEASGTADVVFDAADYK
ncbi:hypothetical protein BH09MYX1_BH09MYX1_48650 [soil metagenome]